MKRDVTSLWRHPDFIKLWAGQTISGFGGAITGLALPLTAAITLDATPAQMGVLGAVGTAPALLFGLFAGVWVDRIRRRPLLIAAEVGRGLLLGSIPVVALLDLLRIEYLYVISFLIGILTLFFDIAVTSLLPSLIPRPALVEGNSKLQLSSSVTSVAGPGLAGLVVQLLSAPLAIAFHALSSFLSALCLGSIRASEPAPMALPQSRSMWREIKEGLAWLFKNPLLQAMTISSGLGSLALSIQQAVFVLFVTRELGVTPAWLGIILSSAGLASLIGALLASPAARWFGPGPALVWGTLLVCIGRWLIPVAGGLPFVEIALLIAAQVIAGIGTPIYSVNQISIRQLVTPDHVLGRVNASRRFIVFGVSPIGALVGGALGETIGLRATLVVGAAGMLLSLLWAVFSPLRTLYEPPAPVEQ